MVEEKKRAKNPLEMFFGLGNKVTKGDPIRKSQFDYAMLWVMFLAFFSICVSSIISGIRLIGANEFSLAIRQFGWAGVMMAILWFQYFALKQAWITKNNMSKLKNIQKKPETYPVEEDSIEEMMDGFKDK